MKKLVVVKNIEKIIIMEGIIKEEEEEEEGLCLKVEITGLEPVTSTLPVSRSSQMS